MMDIKNKNGKILFSVLEANLREADLRGANLRDANLRHADLRDANLRYADLREADLRGADLRRADLRGADLKEANLREANLQDASLQKTNLEGTNLQEANLDFSSGIPFYCGSFDLICDDRLFWQMICHIERFNVSNCSKEVKKVHKLLLPWANEFCKYRDDVEPIGEEK